MGLLALLAHAAGRPSGKGACSGAAQRAAQGGAGAALTTWSPKLRNCLASWKPRPREDPVMTTWVERKESWLIK